MSATLLEASVPRTLVTWTDRFARPEWRGATVEGWLFEGAAGRRGSSMPYGQERISTHEGLHEDIFSLLELFRQRGEAALPDDPPLEHLELPPPPARSRQGRAVEGVHHPGAGAPVFISGGQHANETSGTSSVGSPLRSWILRCFRQTT